MAEGDNDTCLELALEGEKLCKAGKCTFLIIIVEVVNIQPSANWELLNNSYSVFITLLQASAGTESPFLKLLFR